MEAVEPKKEFWLADWRVKPDLSEIEREGTVIQLEPRVMAVLVTLATKPGEVFSRQQLEQQVWQGMVLGYDALAKAINKLRDALGDDKKNPRYIQTISKKGYRLIAEVRAAPAEVTGYRLSESTVSKISNRQANLRTRVLAGVGSVLILLLVLWNFLQPQERTERVPSIQPVPAYHDRKPTIVVLPFRNISPDDEDNYLADGLTSDLTTNLSKLSGMWVTAPTATLAYKDSHLTPELIRKQFNARYVLSGEVNKNAQLIRINAHFTDLNTGKILWADRYDRQFKDLFAIQDDVTKKILDSLSITLTREEKRRLANLYTNNLLAYEYFQRGQALINRRTTEDNSEARDFFRKALELDPEFGRAAAAIAMTYATGFLRKWSTDVEDPLQEALALSRYALRIDKDLAESYWVAGYVSAYLGKTDEAIDYINQALRLNPNYADAYAMLAWIRIGTGQAEEAVKYMQTAYYLNPVGGFLYDLQLGKAYYFLGNSRLAVSYLQKSQLGNPVFIDVIYFLAAAYVSDGRLEDAAWMINEAKNYSPDLDVESWLERRVERVPAYRERLRDDLIQAVKYSSG